MWKIYHFSTTFSKNLYFDAWHFFLWYYIGNTHFLNTTAILLEIKYNLSNTKGRLKDVPNFGMGIFGIQEVIKRKHAYL